MKSAEPTPHRNPFAHLLSHLLSILLLIAILVSAVLTALPAALSDESISRAVRSADLYQLADETLGLSVSALLRESAPKLFTDIITFTDEAIHDAVNCEAVYAFAEKKAIQYVRAIQSGTENASVTSAEISALLRRIEWPMLSDLPEEATELLFACMDLLLMEKSFEEFSVAAIREQNEPLFSAVAYLFSDALLYASYATAAVLALLILLLGLRHIGQSLFLIGFPLLANGLFLLLATNPLLARLRTAFSKDTASELLSLITPVTDSLREALVHTGGVLFAIGGAVCLLALLIGILSVRRRRSA